MGKKRFERLAKVIERCVILFGQITHLYTPALAETEPTAIVAVAAFEMSGLSEIEIFFPGHNLFGRILHNISDIPFFCHEEVAGENIAVVLYDEIFPAGILIHAAFGSQPDFILEEVIEKPDTDIGITVPDPFIEHVAEKTAIVVDGYGERCNFIVDDLHTGNKLEIMKAVPG